MVLMDLLVKYLITDELVDFETPKELIDFILKTYKERFDVAYYIRVLGRIMRGEEVLHDYPNQGKVYFLVYNKVDADKIVNGLNVENRPFKFDGLYDDLNNQLPFHNIDYIKGHIESYNYIASVKIPDDEIFVSDSYSRSLYIDELKDLSRIDTWEWMRLQGISIDANHLGCFFHKKADDYKYNKIVTYFLKDLYILQNHKISLNPRNIDDIITACIQHTNSDLLELIVKTQIDLEPNTDRKNEIIIDSIRSIITKCSYNNELKKDKCKYAIARITTNGINIDIYKGVLEYLGSININREYVKDLIIYFKKRTPIGIRFKSKFSTFA